MAFNEKLGRGSLSKSRKEIKPGAPEYYGSLTIETPINAGDKVWLSGWIKASDTGDRFFSLVVERPPNQERKDPQRQQSSNGNFGTGSRPTRNDIDDDIPFAPEFR